MSEYEVDEIPHYLWSIDHEPRLRIQSGDVVSFRAREALNGQFDSLRTGDDIPNIDWGSIYPLIGPIWVDGAEAGDVLEIEILDVSVEDWGWTAVLPGLGLLTEDFPESYFHRWDFNGTVADFNQIAQIPIRPFFGVIGVCPDVDTPMDVLPPGPFGGNIDCRDIVAGAKLYLPVQTAGGRVAIGDPHAAQGDGEVCVSAIEASASGAVRITLHKDRSISRPEFQTPGPLRTGIDKDGYYATMGVADDLMVASKDALRGMVDHLTARYGMEPIEAYVLSSTVVDLKITEVVDAPNWVVSAYLPLSVMR